MEQMDIQGDLLDAIHEIRDAIKTEKLNSGSSTGQGDTPSSTDIKEMDSIPYFYRKKDFPNQAVDSVEMKSTKTGEFGPKKTAPLPLRLS